MLSNYRQCQGAVNVLRGQKRIVSHTRSPHFATVIEGRDLVRVWRICWPGAFLEETSVVETALCQVLHPSFEWMLGQPLEFLCLDLICATRLWLRACTALISFKALAARRDIIRKFNSVELRKNPLRISIYEKITMKFRICKIVFNISRFTL